MNDDMMFAREDELAALNTPDDGVDAQKYLIFMADELKLGVVAEHVVEILTNQPITYLPMVPDFIRGIINMRGQMIPILDIRARLGMDPRRTAWWWSSTWETCSWASWWTPWTRCWTYPRPISTPCPPTARSCWYPACALCLTVPAP